MPGYEKYEDGIFERDCASYVSSRESEKRFSALFMTTESPEVCFPLFFVLIY